MTSGSEYLSRAYALKGVEDASALYNEWAASYDSHMQEFNYLAPEIVATAIPKYGIVTGRILDAGCGSGLVGVALRKLQAATVMSTNGTTSIDGLDISPGMLAIAAETECYQKLEIADLTKPLDISNGTYDAVVCCGTLTHGHVGPVALQEFVRIIKTGGIIVATVIDDIWESLGYKAEVESLASKEQGRVEILSTDPVEFRKESKAHMRLVVLRRL